MTGVANERNKMKTTRVNNWTAVCAAVLAATIAFRAAADQTAVAGRPEKSYTGTVVSVNPKENTLETRGFVLSKKFNLGTGCDYNLLDKNASTASDLRPGEK